MSLRARVHAILNDRWGGGKTGLVIDIGLVVLIGANIIAFILETEPTLEQRFSMGFRAFETASVAIFSAEYLLRLWSCTEQPAYRHPVLGRLRWMSSPMALVDLAAIAPFYLPFLGIDLRAARVLRLARMLRLAKLGRYTSAITLIGLVLRERRSELLAVLSVSCVIVLLSSVGMYYAERTTQPETFGSVPRAMLWTITNLTPLSVTSARPITPIGLGLSVGIAIVGVGIIAMPTGIVGAGFVEHIRKRGNGTPCPHCGRSTETR